MQLPRRSPILILGAAAGALLLTAPLWPQGGRLKIPPPPPAPAQEPPPEQPQEPIATAPAQTSLWAAPANPAETIFGEFESSGDLTAARRGATLERLRALGLDTRATALKALASSHGPTVLLAAELLEWVGMTASEDPGDVAALVDAASRTSLVEAAGRCLDAAARLNGGALPARAISLLSHPNRNVRTVAEGRLREAPAAAHLERLLQTAEHGRDADVRLRGTRLLARLAGAPEARPVLRRLLRDESVEVAFTAAEALAGEARPEQSLFLVSELRQRVVGAEAGYLAFALLRQQEVHDGALLAEDVLPRLEALLQDPDLFASGAAAACLAEYAYRAEQEAPASWSAPVCHALVRAVGGVVFYPQYARFSPLAVTALERACGEEFPDRAGWLDWHERGGSQGLRFLRARMTLPGESLARLRVTWSRVEGGAFGAQRTLAGAAAWLRPEERLIGARVQQELAQALAASGMLEPAGTGNRYGAAADPLALRIEIDCDGQRKRLSFRGAAAQGGVAHLLGRLETWYDDHGWQVLAGSEGAAFLQLHLDAMEGFDAGARAAAMVELSRGRLTALADEALAQWCKRLLAAPGVAAAMDAALSAELLAAAPARAANPDVALLLAETALLRGDAALAAPLADAAAAVEEPLRSQLLAAGLPRLGLETARGMLADPRLPLRIAALGALRVFGSEGAPELRAALTAAEPVVRIAALRALGEIADRGSYDAIAALAGPDQAPELRKEAAWALGRIGDARAVPTLRAAAGSEYPSLRVTALLALAATPGPEASAALSDLFVSYAGTALEGSYLRALLERGAASARATLQPYLVHADPLLARRAALLGGFLGDPATATNLMAWLPSDPRNPELLEALASTLCVDFRGLPDPSGTYLAWWRDHAERPAWAWFQEASAGFGYTLAAGFGEPGLPGERESVRTLLAILERGPAHLRASATYFLHGLTGVDGQVVLAGTPRHELERRVQPWRAWLDG